MLSFIAYTFRENREFVIVIIAHFIISANSRIRFGFQIVLFVHYTISLSSLRKLIWRHWIYKMPVRYILSSVWVRLSIFSQLSITQYMGLCVFSLPISLVMIDIIYILCLTIIIKSQVWTIIHCLGLGHETLNNMYLKISSAKHWPFCSGLVLLSVKWQYACDCPAWLYTLTDGATVEVWEVPSLTNRGQIGGRR